MNNNRNGSDLDLFIEKPSIRERLHGSKDELIRIGCIAISALAISVGVKNTIEQAADRYFPTIDVSTETKSYIAQPGDGLYDAAGQVSNPDNVDLRDIITIITTNPENSEFWDDGEFKIQVNDNIVIPVEVTKE